MSLVLKKYAAALLPVILIVMGGLQAAAIDGLLPVEVVQLGILAAGVAPTYVLKVVSGPWPGILKTGSAIVAAVLTALVPFFMPGGFVNDLNTWLVVIIAGLNILVTEIGVEIRRDSMIEAVTDSAVDTAAARATDPLVYDITSLPKMGT